MDKSRFFSSLNKRISTLAIALGTGMAITVLSGCAASPSVPSAGGPLGIGALNGKAMGGNTPIGGGLVTLYATAVNTSISNGAYVGAATVLGTTTTDVGTGYFSFGTVTPCTAGTQVYVTIADGNTGGGTNADMLLGSMLGPCGSVAPFAVVNEATTVAMAYAMSSFLSIDGSGNVNITAPAANSSTAATNDVSSGTVSKASGLAHAYANFLNLVNVPNGAALAVPVSNPNGIAPQAVINSLASVLQTCVNSNGAGSNCANLFAAAPALDGTSPTNTFQAALNMARNPAADASGLYGLLTGIGASAVYSPTLTGAPKDWTLAISYPVPPNPVSGLGFPFTVALDADDIVYVTSPENDVYAPVGTVGSYTANVTSTSNSACLFGFSGNGALLTSVTPYSGTPGSGTPGTSSWYCASGSNASNPDLLTQLAADALGNVWIANLGTSPENVLLKVNTSSPSSATTYTTTDTFAPKCIAVDKEDDVFFTHFKGSSNQSTFYMTANGATGPNQTPFFPSTPPAQETQAAGWLALDSSQNLWASGYANTSLSSGDLSLGGTAWLLPYTGTAGSPAYSVAWQEGNIAGGNNSSKAANSAPYGVAIDSSGNAWFTNVGSAAQGGTTPVGLTQATYSAGTLGNTNVANTLTSLGLVSPKWLEADGNNVLWIADTGGIIAYATTASPSLGEISESGGFQPCIAPSGTTACTYPDNTSTKGIAVDSTGSVWWTTPDSTTTVANSNRLIQLIGTGTATWPLLATGKPGTMPQ